jgi:cytochrome c553
LRLSLAVAVAVTLLLAIAVLVAVAVRVSAARLPVAAAAAEATTSTALHSLGVASRSSATGCGVCLGRGLEKAQLGVTLLAEGLEFAALLVEERDVVVAVAVGFVAGCDGVVA